MKHLGYVLAALVLLIVPTGSSMASEAAEIAEEEALSITVADAIPDLLFGTSGTIYRRLGNGRVWLGSNGTAVGPVDEAGNYFTDGQGKLFTRVGQYLSDNM